MKTEIDYLKVAFKRQVVEQRQQILHGNLERALITKFFNEGEPSALKAHLEACFEDQVYDCGGNVAKAFAKFAEDFDGLVDTYEDVTEETPVPELQKEAYGIWRYGTLYTPFDAELGQVPGLRERAIAQADMEDSLEALRDRFAEFIGDVARCQEGLFAPEDLVYINDIIRDFEDGCSDVPQSIFTDIRMSLFELIDEFLQQGNSNIAFVQTKYVARAIEDVGLQPRDRSGYAGDNVQSLLDWHYEARRALIDTIPAMVMSELNTLVNEKGETKLVDFGAFRGQLERIFTDAGVL